MHIEEITYDGYDGSKHTDKFYFNLNESELLELNYSKKGGYLAWLDRVTNEHDTTKIVPLLRKIILTSYGRKSDDGINFDKSPQISDQFYHTDAYNKLFLKLFFNSNDLVNFCNSIIPKQLSDETKNLIENSDDPEITKYKELAGLTKPSDDGNTTPAA